MSRIKLALQSIKALLFGYPPDKERVVGWGTILVSNKGRTVYVRLRFISDGSVRWDYHPTAWGQSRSSEHTYWDWEQDDKGVL